LESKGYITSKQAPLNLLAQVSYWETNKAAAIVE